MNKERRIQILQHLQLKLVQKYPTLVVNKSVEGKYRLIYPFSGNDQFMIDFSSEVADGIRMCFVLDLDQADPAGDGRRKAFQGIVKERIPQLEKSLDATLVEKQKNKTIISDLRTSWLKNSKHRRMGFHQYKRFTEINFEQHALDDIVTTLSPSIERFIDTTSEMLTDIKIPS